MRVKKKEGNKEMNLGSERRKEGIQLGKTCLGLLLNVSDSVVEEQRNGRKSSPLLGRNVDGERRDGHEADRQREDGIHPSLTRVPAN